MGKIASKNELNYYNKLIYEDRTEEALKEIKRLYSLYPNDYLIVKEYGSLLLKLRMNVNEAIFLLKLSMNDFNRYKIYYEVGNYYLGIGEITKAQDYFMKIPLTDEKGICFRLYGLLKTYIQTDDYSNALDCCKILKEYKDSGEFNVEHLRNARSYVYYKLGILREENKKDNYFTEQLCNYNREGVIEHIKEHLPRKNMVKEYNSSGQEIIHSVFKEDVNIEELYDKCLDYITNSTPYTYGIVDYYVYDTGSFIGTTYSGYDTNSVEICTFPKSNQILSIYPVHLSHVNKRIITLTMERNGIKTSSNKDYKKKLKKKPKK